MMKQISILGCGWLGLPLAKILLENNFTVNGSTTSSNKLSILENSGIQSFLISLESDSISGNIDAFLKESSTLIIDIPPKLRGNSKEDFVGKIKTLIPFIEKSAIENVLFISSTSVFGEANLIVTEETIPNPDTESGKQLLETEHILQSNSNFKTTVLRFGGLIGDDRHPVRFLAGRTNLENPEAPINLIHQDDCIGIIIAILEQNSWNETYNAVAPFHPSRKEYYTQKAFDLGLSLPEFNSDMLSVGKTISSSKIENVLGYFFLKPKL
jgi:nucleoside-diphosphate-sugar epimerase